ncbi:MAG TPA: methyltransferase [Acidimicrobiales bacterium]|nr:methyltransferase [Acidimicrobiales bacterium]
MSTEMHSAGAQPSANGHREAAHAECVWYDRGWEQETQRLRSLEAEFDPGTCRLLDSLGVVDGWHCLEVGAGAGSIARWMAERTAPGGRVIAVDLDLRHMNSARFGNLETRALDIVVDDIGEAVFDLVHARAVLEHIPARQAALRRIVSALKPGGWLLVEDFDVSPAMVSALAPYMPTDPELGKRVMSAIAPLYAAAGVDPSFGSRLTGALRDCGLEDVQGEMRASILGGGSDDFWHLSLQLVTPELVRQGLVTLTDVERLIDLTGDPRVQVPPIMLIAAWGRRPLVT